MVLAFATPQVLALYLIPQLHSIPNASFSFRFLPDGSSSREQPGTAAVSSDRHQPEAPRQLRGAAAGASADDVEQRDKSSLKAAVRSCERFAVFGIGRSIPLCSRIRESAARSSNYVGSDWHSA